MNILIRLFRYGANVLWFAKAEHETVIIFISVLENIYNGLL